ncbi:hypothetical protein COO60DRAFT_636421 [Scenedesmus sp. NREL 46B-D3]|nr:hypothetical protein COO60DRAFT_636421 [Scenedesmus sp. NREL 46B-D3]
MFDAIRAHHYLSTFSQETITMRCGCAACCATAVPVHFWEVCSSATNASPKFAAQYNGRHCWQALPHTLRQTCSPGLSCTLPAQLPACPMRTAGQCVGARVRLPHWPQHPAESSAWAATSCRKLQGTNGHCNAACMRTVCTTVLSKLGAQKVAVLQSPARAGCDRGMVCTPHSLYLQRMLMFGVVLQNLHASAVSFYGTDSGACQLVSRHIAGVLVQAWVCVTCANTCELCALFLLLL